MQTEKQYTRSTPSWWLILFVVADIVRSVKTCFARLQYLKVTSSEQYEALQKLASTLQNRFEENGPDEVAVLSDKKIERQVCSSSPYALQMYRTLDREAEQELVLAVKAALRMFIDEVLDIRLSIEPSFTETTPKAIILACDEDFATILSVHQARLSATFGPEVISMIWVQRKDLKEEDYDQRNTKNKVDRLSKLDINGAWSDSDFDTRFDALKDFALGLASIPPGTHSVEADFSLHKRTKSKLRTQLSDFSLEGKLHAAQYVKVISAAADKLAVNP